jgi:hypothetical protein
LLAERIDRAQRAFLLRLEKKRSDRHRYSNHDK